ncbi:MAG TPA: hypothetical protein VHY10_10230 [Xanthobacteraceae bacterium]|nr:hypothetical protein [Xanthobacteraceae bacterium]
MTRPAPALDLVANLALAGAAALIVVRPRHAAKIASSSLLQSGLVKRLTPSPAPPPSPLSKLKELRRLTRRYAPPARAKWSRLTRTSGRKLNGSAALLAFSVLADSAIEHYRGSFQNRAMYTPLVAAAVTLGASLFGLSDARARKHAARDVVYASAAATGFTGLGFHFYNILKRPGGWSWLNLFYAAPIGAPMALALAGLVGRGAERVRDTAPLDDATVLGMPAGRMLAAVTAAGLAGTVAEAGLLHFRGAYHDPAMLLPVTVPPIASVALGVAALRPGRTINRLARWWLRFTALLGFAGVGFHAYGVARNMGGWRNWSQNVLNGPPLPAPPSFTGLALAGLAALTLIEEAETDV